MDKTKTEQLRKLLAEANHPLGSYDQYQWLEANNALDIFLRNNAALLLELVEAAEKAEKKFLATNDGFFTNVVPIEFAPVSVALRKWNGGE